MTGCFNGRGIDVRFPIYWANIPKRIPLSEWVCTELYSGDLDDEKLLENIVESLIESTKPLVILATEDILDDVLMKFNNQQVDTSEKIKFSIHYTKEEKPDKANPFYFQRKPFDEQLCCIPVSIVFNRM